MQRRGKLVDKVDQAMTYTNIYNIKYIIQLLINIKTFDIIKAN